MKSDAKRIPDIWYLRLTNDTLYCILNQRMPHLFNNIFVFLLLKIPHCYNHYIARPKYNILSYILNGLDNDNSNTVNYYLIEIGRHNPWYLIQMSPKR